MPSRALVLFDIDGTLVRRAGPHHRRALEFAARKVTGLASATTEGIPTQGMLDTDIVELMLANVGLGRRKISEAIQEIFRLAGVHYVRIVPNLEKKRCPAARLLLWHLRQKGVPAGLVTGNIPRIGWKKMERAGLKHYLGFGAFAGSAKDRAGLVKLALEHARRERLIDATTPVTLIGDHPNDILAAKRNGVRVVAVATGVVGEAELAEHRPDILVPDLRALRTEALLHS